MTEKKYLTKDDLIEEMSEFIEVKTKDGKWVVFKKLTKGEEKDIRKKTMKMVKNSKGILEPQLDTEQYQILLLAAALVKPKLSIKEVEAMWGQRADELLLLYTQKVGYGNLPQNL